MPEIILLLHNIRSTHNVGSIFRTADGLGVKEIILSGYTPYPSTTNDPRLPHLREKITKDIHKTALGAEISVPFRVLSEPPFRSLKDNGYRIVALEQAPYSIPLETYRTPQKVALLVGEEVDGITKELLSQCDEVLEIAMVGTKESFNVSVATAISLYQLTRIGYNKA